MLFALCVKHLPLQAINLEDGRRGGECPVYPGPIAAVSSASAGLLQERGHMQKRLQRANSSKIWQVSPSRPPPKQIISPPTSPPHFAHFSSAQLGCQSGSTDKS